jgi:putative endonuclease
LTKERLELGRLGEALALKKVKALGYKCIVRNYRCPLGEVDLIAKDGKTLVFVEIKTRKRKSLGYAKEAVTERKKRQLSKVALAYMKANDCSHMKSRFDVVAINIINGKSEIEVIRNAFDLAYE